MNAQDALFFLFLELLLSDLLLRCGHPDFAGRGGDEQSNRRRLVALAGVQQAGDDLSREPIPGDGELKCAVRHIGEIEAAAAV